jgi:hypothetical protein
MLTTITVNGSEGYDFLAHLGARFHGALPPALAAMVASRGFAEGSAESITHAPDLEEPISIQVDAGHAEEIAAFVEELVHAGYGNTPLPLLFSAQTGDLVLVVRDVLAELQVGKREPKTWQLVARGTRGRMVARRGDVGKLLVLDGPAAREHVYVSDRSTTRARPIAQRQFLR